MTFFPLNVHSEYSILKSALKIGDYAERLLSLGYEGGAIADPHHLYGFGAFATAMKKSGLKPLYGVELDFTYFEFSFTLSLYILKEDGYSNLLKLINNGNESDLPLDSAVNGDGLAAVLHPDFLKKRDLESESLKSLFIRLDTVFSAFYFGIEIYSEADQSAAEQLRQFTAEHSFQTIAFPKVLYLHKKDAGIYDLVRAIADNKVIESVSAEGPYFLLSPKAVEALYSQTEIANSQKVAAEASFDFLHKRGEILKYHTLKEESDSELSEAAHRGLSAKGLASDSYVERLDSELSIIASMGYSDYFLIVADYVDYAKKVGIAVGPGRGSAAGSLVSYALGITAVDPIRFGLSFERFLNPLRTSMPDIDIDFEDEKRDQIIAYLKRRYGEKKAANIVTFNTLKLRSALRKAGEALNYPSARIDRLAKLIGSRSESFRSELITNRLLAEEAADPYYRTLIKAAEKIIGFPVGTSIHAAGVILSNQPVDSAIEFQHGIIGLEAGYLETLGFLKMDILGLRNLTFIKNIEENFASNFEPIDILSVLDDPDSYRILNSLQLCAIFQLESEGIKQAVQTIHPENFSDLTALLALYRPGPMANIGIYSERKKNKIAPVTGYPALDNELADTYGIIVYQEQIMRIAQKVALFTPGKADLLRRAITKKDAGKMEALQKEFIKGSIENGYRKEDAEHIYELLYRFANYGFNKSHSVSYSLITLKLLYYKAHCPAYFYQTLFDEISLGDSKFRSARTEAESFGLTVRVPDINKSGEKVILNQNELLLPLKAISGLTPTFRRDFYEIRRKARFETLAQLLSTLQAGNLLDLNSFKALINSGALDCFGYSRTGLLKEADRLLTDSFYMLGDETILISDPPDRAAEFIREKNSLGRAISIHINDIIPERPGYRALLATSEEVRTRHGYRFEATDGDFDYQIYTDSQNNIVPYDLLSVRGTADHKRLTINAKHLIKESQNV